MKTDKEVGGLICKIAQDTVEHFKKTPNPPSIRFFGSLGKAVYTGETPISNLHDLDIDIIGTSSQQKDTVDFFMKEAEIYSESSSIAVEAKQVGGVAKPIPHPSKRKLFLHLMPTDEKALQIVPNYVKHSILKYGTQITGKLPDITYIERIGLTASQKESQRRIKQITGIAKGYDAINRISKNGDQIEISNEVAPDSLENLSYSVRNNAANIMAAIQPYISTPHFDNSPKVFQDFYSTFKTHPWKSLPLEINALTKQERNGNKVNTKGLKGEALNFLAYNDQMIRNMIG